MKEEKNEKITKADVMEKVSKVKKTAKNMTSKIKEKVEDKEERKQIKPLVTSRILFISVLDKIYIFMLLIMFITATFNIFAGDISSLNYGFWQRIFQEIGMIIGFCIIYFIFNWLYKCAAKTMLCLTENEVYKESYWPFKRSETSIPLNKITGITTYKFFWIFRSIIIHQYGKLPVVFMTWNNQEFKNKLTELITTENKKVENEYENRNIINKDNVKFLKWLGYAFAIVIVLLGFIRFFSFLANPGRRLDGTYVSSDKKIILEKDGTCNINNLKSNVEECEWEYDEEYSRVEINYKYYSRYSSYILNGSISLDFNKDDKTLTYNDQIFKK